MLLTEGVPDEKDTTAVRFIGRLYVQHTTNNNAVLEKGYTAFNKCVDAFCVSIIALIALALPQFRIADMSTGKAVDDGCRARVLDSCKRPSSIDQGLAWKYRAEQISKILKGVQ